MIVSAYSGAQDWFTLTGILNHLFLSYSTNTVKFRKQMKIESCSPCIAIVTVMGVGQIRPF
jgi:hypothetical protein